MVAIVKRRGRNRPEKEKKGNRRVPQSGAIEKGQKRRARNPDATIKDILEAALSCLASAGPEGVSLSQVAVMAGVNRSTAYAHFKTRERLIAKTIEWASNQLLRAVYGDVPESGAKPIDNLDKLLTERRAGAVLELHERLGNFAMNNPELCRVWLMQVLTLPDPKTDPFWKEYEGSTARFAKTKLAQTDIDAEVLSVIMLAGAFLWPISARAHTKDKGDLRAQAYRWMRECARLGLHGIYRPEEFPDLLESIKPRKGKSEPPRA